LIRKESSLPLSLAGFLMTVTKSDNDMSKRNIFD